MDDSSQDQALGFGTHSQDGTVFALPFFFFFFFFLEQIIIGIIFSRLSRRREASAILTGDARLTERR